MSSADPNHEATDEALFALAAQREERPTAARAAEAELYRRHVRYLYGVVKRREAALSRLCGVSPEDLVQETFQRAFSYAASYSGGGVVDPEQARRRARAWLGRIAENLVIDSLARPAEVSASPLLERVIAEDDDDAPPSSPELRALREALATLSEREQDVLRVTAMYQRLGEEHQRLPNEVSAELAARWGTNSQNIRAIRSRALKKLDALLRGGGSGPEEER